MRIAVNTRLVMPGRMDGMGWFAFETTRRLVADHPEHRFLLLFDRPCTPPAGDRSWDFLHAPNVEVKVLCPPTRHPLLWMLYFELSLPAALRCWKADLYLTPDGMMPRHPHVPTLTVIHDINFEHAADNLRRSHQCYMTHFFPRFARAAARVATVSEYSRQDIAATYGVDPARIDVVYDGAHARYRPHTADEQAATRQRFTGGAPYLIFVSTILRRKNLTGLLKAFDMVKESHDGSLKLLVVGNRFWWGDELKEAYDAMRHRDDVIFIGRADPADLSALLSSSEMLVYPSFFEGFGIPILEAMYAETAVVCSNTTSMPEVGGDAVLYADPASPTDIADAIGRILADPSLRDSLIERGRTQRQLYSWQRTTDLLWESVMKVVK